MIFADASALIAILGQEKGALQVAERLDEDRDRLCSAIVIWETVAGLCRSYEIAVQGARLYVRDFLEDFRFRVVGSPRSPPTHMLDTGADATPRRSIWETASRTLVPRATARCCCISAKTSR